ncbi:uncharacterized protein J4E88_003303 [Alternaria novae-zelandiae]|uniref:uncharacterized protein n=1 Tax=Alternaria novae-zelandiae TaxID=430562 RepID=UPI0020C5614B|nr:uncharacterized protein J4E88_003303 [Alternaria novae-zelandiae]KAI4687712.1 hypothetical protein J4E88_003303 [Alternaria novae-zelandiae]
MAPKTTKRRKMRPYERKALIIEQLGFGRQQAIRDWRASDLVKPHWERFSKHFLDSFLSKSGKKDTKFVHVYTRMINGEKHGARTFSARINRQYTTDIDWHAWLLYCLVDQNTKDRNGCFYAKRLEELATYRYMWDFIAFEKRQRARGKGKGKGTASSSKTAPSSSRQLDLLEATSSEDAYEHRLHPDEGVASIFWVKGMPEALEDEVASIKATVKGFCGYTESEFERAVMDAFDLRSHRQIVVELEATGGLTYIGAQYFAHRDGKKVIFMLTTREVANEEEMKPVPLLLQRVRMS